MFTKSLVMSAVVNTLYGAVQGCEGTDLDGNNFHQFLGIPYAKPPVGEFRFKDPEPLEPWEGVKDATKEGNLCFQISEISKKPIGSEDCLYLNIFTRELPSETNSLKPVMIWVHGGSFKGGSNSRKVFGPDFLLSENIVLVSINYRLGLLGFLQAPKFGIYGNMGLKDQIIAFKWIKDNISRFNGDPKNITLFGESSGAACVHYHILSPMSKGLFQKAIIQSGASLNPWADETGHDIVKIARIENDAITTEEQALHYFKIVSVPQLLDMLTTYITKAKVGEIWHCGLALDAASPVPFMPERPIDIITSGNYTKMPIIFGYTDREGIYFNQLIKAADARLLYGVERFIPYQLYSKDDPSLTQRITEKLKEIYFQGDNEDDGFIALTGDSWFSIGVIGSAKRHAETSPFPVYLYKMTLDTKLNTKKAFVKASKIPGCSHADDLGYLFKSTSTPPIKPGSIEDVSLRRIIRLWANFARYSNPTPDADEFEVTWDPMITDRPNILNIGEKLAMEILPGDALLRGWKEIYSQSTKTKDYI